MSSEGASGDCPEMNAAFVERLRAAVPACGRLYDEHIATYDEVIPYVFVGELAASLSEQEAAGDGDGAADAQLGAFLEDELARASHAGAAGDWRACLVDLVWFGLFENFDPGSSALALLVRRAGPLLEAEYRAFARGHLEA